MKPILIAIALTLAARAEEVREPMDFNFDGVMDYRVKVLENGKADLYDVYIAKKADGDFVKDHTLSGVINPKPDPESQTIRCLWPGGHSGMLYSADIYRWSAGKAEWFQTQKQTDLLIDGKLIYVRVTSEVRDSKAVITSVEHIATNH